MELFGVQNLDSSKLLLNSGPNGVFVVCPDAKISAMENLSAVLLSTPEEDSRVVQSFYCARLSDEKWPLFQLWFLPGLFVCHAYSFVNFLIVVGQSARQNLWLSLNFRLFRMLELPSRSSLFCFQNKKQKYILGVYFLVRTSVDHHVHLLSASELAASRGGR